MTTPDRIDHAARVRGLARVLDSAVGIPGTRIRFGLDSLIGLVPGVGDLAGAALSGYIVLSAARAGVPAVVLSRMLLNLGVDTIVGSVPLLGDAFDVGFRANTRNAALMERHLAVTAEPGVARKSSRASVAVVIGGVALLAAVGIALAVLAARVLNMLVA